MTEQGKTHLTTNVSEGRSGAEDCRESAMSNKPVACSKTVIAPERAHSKEGLERQDSVPERAAASSRPLGPSGRTGCDLGLGIGSLYP